MSKDLFDLGGCVAVVSGGGGWLGSATVEALANAGAQVVSVGRDEVQLKRALDARGLAPEQVTAVGCDVTTAAWGDLLEGVTEQRGRIDILVNNAHVGSGGSLATSTTADFRLATEMSLVAPVAGIRAALPGFDASVAAGGSPCVINIASMYGIVSPDSRLYDSEEARNPPHYGAAKAGLIQLTRYAAAELGPRGVRVNCISPGPFPGGAAQFDKAFVDRLAARTMLGRVGSPDDIRTAILFLASQHSRFVTGTNIVVDGGWTAW